MSSSSYDVLRKNLRKETKGVCCTPVFFTVSYEKNNDFVTGSQNDGSLYKPRQKVTVRGQGTLFDFFLKFKEWNTEPDGTGLSFKEKDTFLIDKNVILYAQWMSNYEWLPYPRS